MSVVFSAEAEQDLFATLDLIALQNPVAADALLDSVLGLLHHRRRPLED